MLLPELKSIVGEGSWITNPDELEPYLTEWRGKWLGKAAILVSPSCTDEVSAIVKACVKAGSTIVPQGGNTGLCGGAIPDQTGQQVILSMTNMNVIRDVSPLNYSLIAEAGCTLLDVQEAASNDERFFPLSLGAEGSCQIGGNISTNAGGVNVLNYGNARDQVLGLEVVLSDGSIWNGLHELRKDNSGYDLKHFFIGAEGTLGIITAAALKLYPAPLSPETMVFALTGLDKSVKLLSLLRNVHADQIQAFELIPNRAVDFVNRHIPAVNFPIKNNYSWYVLAEVNNCDNAVVFDKLISEILSSGYVADAVIAKNQNERESIWHFRHSISEAQKLEGVSLKHDISVPVSSVIEFIESAEKAVIDFMPNIRPVPFGHVGDGNIHFNLSQPKDISVSEFKRKEGVLSKIIYDITHKFGGSFSAEHGIGQAKREELLNYRGELEINLMRAVKKAIDPDNIFNPGKIF